MPDKTPSDGVGENDPNFAALVEVAQSIGEVNKKLALIGSSKTNNQGEVKSFEIDYKTLPDLWKSEVTMVAPYHGQLNSFISLVSKLSGLNDPRFVGQGVSRTPIISVGAGTRPLIDWILDVAQSAGDRVVVSPSFPHNKIFVRYKRAGDE